jgi:FkbM family methyltransferase
VRKYDLLVANVRDALLLNAAFPLRHLAPLFGVRELGLNIRGFGKVIFRTDGSDATTLREIFRDQDFDVTRYPQGEDITTLYKAILEKQEIPIIIDAGANIGATAIWFAKAFPQAAVLAIEPGPRNADLCRRNTSSINAITVIEAALGATVGQCSISNNKAQSWAFQTSRSDQGKIPIVTIPELAKSIPHGCLFAAKVDIEGFESDVFSYNTDWLDDLKFLFLEPHDWMLPGSHTSREFQKRVAQSDFELIVAGQNLLYVRAAILTKEGSIPHPARVNESYQPASREHMPRARPGTSL